MQRICIRCDDHTAISACDDTPTRSHQVQVVRRQERHGRLEGAELREAGERALRHGCGDELVALTQRRVLRLVEKGGERVLLEGRGGDGNIRGNREADVGVERGGLQTQEARGEQQKGLRDGLQEAQTEVAAAVEPRVVVGVQRTAGERAAAGEEERDEAGEPLGEIGGD